MEECHQCNGALGAELGEAAVVCTGACRRLFHARCTNLCSHADVADYLSRERRWKCADCEEKCAACSDSVACGALAGVVMCGGSCGRLYHAKCTDLSAVADLRQYLTHRQSWLCDSCRGHKSGDTQPEAPIEPSAPARVERGDVEAICRSMLEVEKCLEQFSRKLELFERDVMSVNGCVRAATEEICKSNAEGKQVGEEIEQLSTEVQRSAAAVPEVADPKEERAEDAAPAEVREVKRSSESLPQDSKVDVRGKDAPVEVAVQKVAPRREKSLSLGGRRRNSQDSRSERVPVLYRMTKQFARENDYRLVWIHHADVFLRKRPGSSARKVKHKDDLRTEDAPATATQVT